MDKAQEKIATFLGVAQEIGRRGAYLDVWGNARTLLNELQELGYRKIEGKPELLSDKCDHIFERLRLDMRRCIECGLEQLKYVDPVEPLKWVDSPKG